MLRVAVQQEARLQYRDVQVCNGPVPVFSRRKQHYVVRKRQELPGRVSSEVRRSTPAANTLTVTGPDGSILTATRTGPLAHGRDGKSDTGPLLPLTPSSHPMKTAWTCVVPPPHGYRCRAGASVDGCGIWSCRSGGKQELRLGGSSLSAGSCWRRLCVLKGMVRPCVATWPFLTSTTGHASAGDAARQPDNSWAGSSKHFALCSEMLPVL